MFEVTKKAEKDKLSLILMGERGRAEGKNRYFRKGKLNCITDYAFVVTTVLFFFFCI